jgi:ATP-binding cassette subfamily B protein
VIVTSTKKSQIDPRDLPAVDRATLRRIFAYLQPYRGTIGAVTLLIVVAALLNLLPPLLLKLVVDRAIPDRDVTLLWWLCGGMIAGPLTAGLLQIAQRRRTSIVGERVMLDLRRQLFDRLHELPVGWFAAAKPGEAVSRVLNDVQGVGSMLSSTLIGVVENTFVLASAAVTLLVLDWRLALMALALLPLFILPTRRVGRRRKELKRRAQAQMADLTGILVETLSVSGALLLKVFGAEKLEAARLDRAAADLMETSLRQTLVGRWFQLLLGLFESAGPAVLFAAGGWLIIRGQLGLGTVVAFVTVLRRLYQPASQLAGVHVDVMTSYAYFERVFSVLDLEPSIADAPNATPLVAASGSIEFRHVWLSYGRGSDHALADITFSVEPGHSVAIVGASGAGKSTLASLVPRLYDPTSGAVLIDGRDARTITLASLRSRIAVVLQDTYLFHASIADNLRYGRPEATDAELQAATRATQIHDFICQLPDSYDTVVGNRGYHLSGGERQRIAIARAMLRDPRILILDEATSALDSANEALVQLALAPLLAGRTSLVIAHRLSTVMGAGEIIVLEHGRIAARGDHRALLRQSRVYSELFQQQMIAVSRSSRVTA